MSFYCSFMSCAVPVDINVNVLDLKFRSAPTFLTLKCCLNAEHVAISTVTRNKKTLSSTLTNFWCPKSLKIVLSHWLDPVCYDQPLFLKCQYVMSSQTEFLCGINCIGSPFRPSDVTCTMVMSLNHPTHLLYRLKEKLKPVALFQ